VWFCLGHAHFSPHSILDQAGSAPGVALLCACASTHSMSDQAGSTPGVDLLRACLSDQAGSAPGVGLLCACASVTHSMSSQA
jgi:hypothetical protein